MSYILFKAKFLLLFIFCFLLVLSSGFYIYYLYKYPKPYDRSYLLDIYPEDLILKTGGILEIPERRFQHFLNFSPSKRKGTIRIGAFGDSHTFGAEVDKTESYPYQLQELFNKQFPNKKIEILNFGVSGHSFQEQFFLWKKYAKNYELDYILLGPRGFYPNREVTFRINWSFKFFKYPKTRFILSKNSNLKQIHIKGDTLEKRYKNYYKLIPSWKALHYDKKPFQIWEKFFPFLRDNIYNPFYYKKMSDKEESVKINIMLLKKMKSLHNKKILFFTDHYGSMLNNYQSVERLYNLNLIRFKKNGFYERFYQHKSTLGNEIIANTYFNALIGNKDFSLKIINCYFKRLAPVQTDEIQILKTSNPKQNDINSASERFRKNLSAVQSIQITDSIQAISSLKRYNSDAYTNKEKSLISFSNKFDFLEFNFIPLSIQLKEGMKIYIQLTDKSRIELGSIKTLDIYRKIFIFYGKYIKNQPAHFYDDTFDLFFLLEKIPSFLKEKIKQINSPVELFVEDYKLGTLQPYNLDGKNSLKFNSVDGYEKSFLMIGPSRSYVREKDFPDEFLLYIQYNMDNGESFKSLIPDWKCKKEKRQIHLNLPNFEPLNL